MTGKQQAIIIKNSSWIMVTPGKGGLKRNLPYHPTLSPVFHQCHSWTDQGSSIWDSQLLHPAQLHQFRLRRRLKDIFQRLVKMNSGSTRTSELSAKWTVVQLITARYGLLHSSQELAVGYINHRASFIF